MEFVKLSNEFGHENADLRNFVKCEIFKFWTEMLNFSD